MKSSLQSGLRIQSVNPSGSGGVTTVDIAEYGMRSYNSQTKYGWGHDDGGIFYTKNGADTYVYS